LKNNRLKYKLQLMTVQVFFLISCLVICVSIWVTAD